MKTAVGLTSSFSSRQFFAPHVPIPEGEIVDSRNRKSFFFHGKKRGGECAKPQVVARSFEAPLFGVPLSLERRSPRVGEALDLPDWTSCRGSLYSNPSGRGAPACLPLDTTFSTARLAVECPGNSGKSSAAKWPILSHDRKRPAGDLERVLNVGLSPPVAPDN